MKTWFAPDQFTATGWSSSAAKARFANHFMRFVESGFKHTLFYRWFYQRLMNTFGHIAHYNMVGFWDEFFTTTKDKLRFLQQTVDPPFGFVGDPHYTYKDVELAIAEKIQANGFLGEWEAKLADETEEGERSELARLKAKYEP